MHPKNTTGHNRMQQQLLTTEIDFETSDGEDRSPFGVNPGIPVADALNAATGLLGALVHIAAACVDRDPAVNDVVAMRFLAQGAQALVTASVANVELYQMQGGAR
ncbi:DUF3077 domain-containing protein [Pseudomonas sp. B26140]|uniref:DUF3077 domain-containing protein n=1 Tax=Pseudomonas sp. B26140 TaxID=3235112 RepID=UPI003783F709